MKKTVKKSWRRQLDEKTPLPQNNWGESETVQGETMSIQEIFARAVAQGNLEHNDEGYLDAPLEDINHLYRQGIDLIDAADHAEHLKGLQQAVDKLAHEQYKVQEKAETSQDEKGETVAADQGATKG